MENNCGDDQPVEIEREAWAVMFTSLYDISKLVLLMSQKLGLTAADSTILDKMFTSFGSR